MASSSSAAPQTDDLLRPPNADSTYPSIERVQTKHVWNDDFEITERSYQQQFSDMYFLRLSKLKPVVEQVANEWWDKRKIGDELVRRVDRVLDVRQGEFCWVSGTIYMDMPLKPNILEDISKDHWIAAPPSREKYTDPSKDQVMLEDESGRLRLVGSAFSQNQLVTGVIVAVLGSENSNGDFEVLDLLLPELPPQPKKLDLRKAQTKGRRVALGSGLSIKGDEFESMETHLLAEWLVGEIGGEGDQRGVATVSHLILAGNSLAESSPLPLRDDDKKTKAKKYGYDAAAYNPSPTAALDALLTSLLPSISITLLPGDSDPANVSLPQQPIHTAMFPNSRAYFGSTFQTGTNPWSGEIGGVKFLGTSGQNLDDIYKYVEDENRLDMCERMLKWRIVAPTAPDTLWSYPFNEKDQFVIEECPHIFFIGNQPEFGTKLVEGPEPEKQVVRIIMIPKFSETSEIVLVDLDTLDCEVVAFKVEGATTITVGS